MKSKQNIKWLIVILSLVLFVFILVNVNNQTPKIDWLFYDYISEFINPSLTNIAIIITNFGGTILLLLITITILIFVKSKHDKIYIILNLITITILNQIIKFLIQRPRPTINQLVTERGYSFPSGHSMISLAYYGFLIYLINKKVKNKKIKYPLIIINSLLIILIGLSRIYLGVHYLTDVAGGFLISLSYLIILIEIYKRCEEEYEK